MSSFTKSMTIVAVPRPVVGFWNGILPPSIQKPRWKVWEDFEYAVGSLNNPKEIIKVEKDFCFDGASVPWLARLLVPMAHPNYIQATALHDWMLESGAHTRSKCDSVFYEALGVLGMSRPWKTAMYYAVRIASARVYALKLIKTRQV